MRWKRTIWIIGIMTLLFMGVRPEAWAQGALFTVDQNISHVYVQADGSADIEYILTFTCAPGASSINIVDVGLPNNTYDLETAKAWYSPGTGSGFKTPLTNIFESEEIDIGVEIWLGENKIQPGKQGTIFFQINVKEMVFPDSADETYASLEFAPTWYGKDYVQGKTYLEINLHFPPGVTDQETRYHDKKFDKARVQDDRFVFTYVYPQATGDETHQHGISFPRKYVDTVHKPPLFGYQFTSTVSKIFNFICSEGGCFTAVFVFIFVVAPVLSIFQNRKRKMKYLPPSLSVEGVGIKRGLTAVEAAILLETPLNKVLTMILFGLLKKRGVVVLSDNPLQLERVTPQPKAKWRPYEQLFLDSIQPDGTLDEKKLQEMLVTLIKELNTKLKGFSRKETVEYYKSIADRAWKQVTAADTPEIKSKYFDQALEWMMLDQEFEERTTETFRRGPVLMPSWWMHYRPWVPHVRSARSGSGKTTTSGGGRGGGRSVTLPTLPGAAFAGTFVSGIERTASGIVSRLDSFTGRVTDTTNPLPKTSSSGSSSSGGCACACACAGCACACAGGGR